MSMFLSEFFAKKCPKMHILNSEKNYLCTQLKRKKMVLCMFIKMAHIEGQRQCRGLVHLKVLIVGMVHLKEAINDGPR